MHGTLEKKDRALFDRIAERYAKRDISPVSSYAGRYQLLSAVRPIFEEVPRVDVLLEVACGPGASATYLSGKYRRYIGIDYSEELVREARTLHGKHPDIEFRVMNVKEAGDIFPKADMILAVGALHHFTEIDEALTSIKRAAKPGAYFVAVEPSRDNPIVQTLRAIRA